LFQERLLNRAEGKKNAKNHAKNAKNREKSGQKRQTSGLLRSRARKDFCAQASVCVHKKKKVKKNNGV